MPKGISWIYPEQLSNRDCAATLVDMTRENLLLAGIHLDYNDDVVQDWLVNIVSYIEVKKLIALLSFDSNTHSQLHGPDTNDRGKRFEEFILQHKLNVEISHVPCLPRR